MWAGVKGDTDFKICTTVAEFNLFTTVFRLAAGTLGACGAAEPTVSARCIICGEKPKKRYFGR